MVIRFLSFWGTFKIFSIVAIPFTVPGTSFYKNFFFFYSHSCQHLLPLYLFIFFYICTTSKVNWQRGFCFFIFFWSELFINDKALANTADHSKKMLIGYLHVFLIIFFFFETGGNLLYKVMLVSAIEQHESAISIPLSTPSWTSLPPFIPSHPSRLSQSTRVSSPCYPATSH